MPWRCRWVVRLSHWLPPPAAPSLQRRWPSEARRLAGVARCVGRCSLALRRLAGMWFARVAQTVPQALREGERARAKNVAGSNSACHPPASAFPDSLSGAGWAKTFAQSSPTSETIARANVAVAALQVLTPGAEGAAPARQTPIARRQAVSGALAKRFCTGGSDVCCLDGLAPPPPVMPRSPSASSAGPFPAFAQVAAPPKFRRALLWGRKRSHRRDADRYWQGGARFQAWPAFQPVEARG